MSKTKEITVNSVRSAANRVLGKVKRMSLSYQATMSVAGYVMHEMAVEDNGYGGSRSMVMYPHSEGAWQEPQMVREVYGEVVAVCKETKDAEPKWLHVGNEGVYTVDATLKQELLLSKPQVRGLPISQAGEIVAEWEIQIAILQFEVDAAMKGEMVAA